MGIVLLMASLAAGLDEDAAGQLYLGALEKVASKRYEEAVRDFDAALAQVPEETAALEFSDAGGASRTIAYYPNYESGQARVLQAREAKTLEEQYRLIQDAVARLGKTSHPNQRASLQKAYLESLRVKTALDASREARPVEPAKPKTFEEEHARVRETVDRLISQERFEDALNTMEWEARVYKDHEAERDQLVARVRSAQNEAVARRLADLCARLDQLAGEKGIPDVNAAVPSLKALRLPPVLQKKPPPAFEWLDRFLALAEKDGGLLGKASALSSDEARRLGEALDRAAVESLDIGLFPGFRAAHQAAYAIVAARLRALDAASPPVPEPAFQEFMGTLTGSLERCAAELRGRREKQGVPEAVAGNLKGYEEGELAGQRREIEEIGRARRQRIMSESLTGWIKGLEESMRSLAMRPDAAPARGLASDAAETRSRPGFETLEPSVRARAFLVQAVSEAFAALLEGEAAEKALERCRPSASEAFKLDPQVVEPWRDRLSPKLLAILDRAKGS